MRRTTIGISLIALLFVVGCAGIPGSGVALTERRTIPEFSRIELRGIGTAEITVGNLSDLEVSGDDNIVPLIRTEVVDKCLVISTEKGVNPRVPLIIRGSTTDIVDASCSGAGDIHISGVKNDGRMRLTISGAGDITFAGSTGEIEAVISGAGDARLTGSANKAHYVVSGSGDIQAKEMVTKSVMATVSGAGDVTLHADESIDAIVSGAGEILYCGNAPKMTGHVSGAGSIRQIKQ